MPEQILSLPSSTTASSEPDVIQTHIAEYEALMTRCNYFIALHVGLWGAVVAVAVGAAQVWVVTRSPTAVWLSVAGIQALLQIWSELIEEQYRTVAYIETELRALVVAALGPHSSQRFWGYEGFLARTRPHASWLIKWIHPIVVSSTLGVFTYFRWSAFRTEWPWFVINILLLLFLCSRTKARVAAHQRLHEIGEGLAQSVGAA